MYVTFLTCRCKNWGLNGTFEAAYGFIYQVLISSVYSSGDLALVDVTVFIINFVLLVRAILVCWALLTSKSYIVCREGSLSL